MKTIFESISQNRVSTLPDHNFFAFEINGPDFQWVNVFDASIVPMFLFLPSDHFDLHFLALEKNFDTVNVIDI